MENRYKLRICVIVNCIVFFVILIVIYFCKDKNIKYLNYGPSENLYVLSVKIDTLTKYLYLQLFLVCVECSSVFINEIASPILGFNIYNSDKKIITEFFKNELQLLANLMWLINSLRGSLFVMITISQFDIAFLRIVYSEITTIFTIRILLNEKKFTVGKEVSDEEIEMGILDNFV